MSLRPSADSADLLRSVEGGANPRDIKFELAIEIVDRFHGQGAGEQAKQAFIARFQQGDLPDVMDEFSLKAADKAGLGIATAIKQAGMAASNSEAFRLIDQGAVKIEGERVSDRGLILPPGFAGVVQVGKRRIARISVEA